MSPTAASTSASSSTGTAFSMPPPMASSSGLTSKQADTNAPDEDDLLPDGATETIDLCHRKMTHVSTNLIAQMRPQVFRLALGYNNIASLPSQFADLTKLRYLNIRANCLSVFPLVITELPALEILDIGRNKIKAMPTKPGSLLNLRVLSISRNRLKRLPPYVARMTHLRILRLERNPLTWPPPAIATFPFSAITPEMPLPADLDSLSERQRHQVFRKRTDEKRRQEEQVMIPWIRHLQHWIEQSADEANAPSPSSPATVSTLSTARDGNRTASPYPPPPPKSDTSRKLLLAEPNAMASQTSLASTVSSLPDSTLATSAAPRPYEASDMDRASTRSGEHGPAPERFYTPPPGLDTADPLPPPIPPPRSSTATSSFSAPPARSSTSTSNDSHPLERGLSATSAGDTTMGDGPPTLHQLANSPLDDPLPPIPRLGFSRWARSRAHRRNESSVSSTSTGSVPKSSSGWAFPRRNRHGNDEDARPRTESPVPTSSGSVRVASPGLPPGPWNNSLSSLASFPPPNPTPSTSTPPSQSQSQSQPNPSPTPDVPSSHPAPVHKLGRAASEDNFAAARQNAPSLPPSLSLATMPTSGASHLTTNASVAEAHVGELCSATDTIEQMVTPTMNEAQLSIDSHHVAPNPPTPSSSSSMHASSYSAGAASGAASVRSLPESSTSPSHVLGSGSVSSDVQLPTGPSSRSLRSPPPPPPNELPHQLPSTLSRQPPQGLRKLSLASSAMTSSSTSHSPSDSVGRLLSQGFTPSLPSLPSSTPTASQQASSDTEAAAPTRKSVLNGGGAHRGRSGTPGASSSTGALPVPPPTAAAHSRDKSIDTERNSYFKRFSAMPMPLATKTIPTPVLRFVDGTRGLLFSLSQIHSALKQYVSLTLDERISLQFHKILEVASHSMTGLIRALDRFDQVARTTSVSDTEHLAAVRHVLIACRDSLSTFKRVNSVLQLQLKPLQQTADVRLTRSFLMMLYGSCVELSNCWTAIEPDREAVHEYLKSAQPQPPPESTRAPSHLRVNTDSKADNTLATISEQSIVSSSSPASHPPWKLNESDSRVAPSPSPTPPIPLQQAQVVRRPTMPYHASGASVSSAEWLDAGSSREDLADAGREKGRSRKRSGFVRMRTGQLMYEDGTRLGSISNLSWGSASDPQLVLTEPCEVTASSGATHARSSPSLHTERGSGHTSIPHRTGSVRHPSNTSISVSSQQQAVPLSALSNASDSLEDGVDEPLDSHLLNLVDKVTMTSATAWANLLGPALDEDILHFTSKDPLSAPSRPQYASQLGPPEDLAARGSNSRGPSPGGVSPTVLASSPRSSTPAGGFGQVRDVRVGTLLSTLKAKATECDCLTGELRSTWQECTLHRQRSTTSASALPSISTSKSDTVRNNCVDRLWAESNQLVRLIVRISTTIKALSPDYSFAAQTLRTLGLLTSTCHELMIHLHFLSPDKMHTTSALVAAQAAEEP